MKESIKDLIADNPSGLLELRPPLTIAQYRENFGFELKNSHIIYKSKRISHTEKEWFAFPEKSLENLFTVQEESDGNLLIVYIVETIKNGQVYCHLILSDQAYQEIVRDRTQHVLQVHQMYSKFWKDYIALNMAI